MFAVLTLFSDVCGRHGGLTCVKSDVCFGVFLFDSDQQQQHQQRRQQQLSRCDDAGAMLTHDAFQVYSQGLFQLIQRVVYLNIPNSDENEWLVHEYL